MRIIQQVIRHNSAQKKASVFMIHGSQRYIFNIPENTQRFTSEYSIKIAQNSKIFLTSADSESTGGLMGEVLTLEEEGLAEGIQIYGPNRAIQNHFSIAEKLNIFGHKSFLITYAALENQKPIFQGLSNMDIIYRLLEINNQEVLETGDFQSAIDTGILKNEDVNNPNHFLSLKSALFAENDNLRNFRDEKDKIEVVPIDMGDDTFSYIVIQDQKTVKFNPDLLHKFGIKNLLVKKIQEEGKIIREADKDKDVVTLDMVSDGIYKGSASLIIDCSSENQIKKLVKSKKIQEIFDKKKEKNYEISTIFHFGSKDVIFNQQYREFLERWNKNVHHIFTHPDFDNFSKNEIFKNSEFQDYKFHQINRQLNNKYSPYFSFTDVFYDDNTTSIQNQDFDLNVDFSVFRKSVEIISDFSLSDKAVLNSDNNNRSNNHNNNNSLEEANFGVQKVNSENEKNEKNEKFEDKPELLILGSASKSPDNHRGVSAYLLRTQNMNILLDCGEGTFSQMVNAFGLKDKKLDAELQKLRIVFVSHIHADHNLGLFRLLEQRKLSFEKSKNEKNKLFLVLPENCIDLLSHMDPEEYSYTVIEASELSSKNKKIFEKPSKNLEIFKQILTQNGLKKLLPVKVIHCEDSHGIVIEGTTGWKFTYSGDCRPSGNLIKEGHNSTLLLHEATFLIGQEAMARKKMHSTVRDAIKMARKMKAQYTALTHFSKANNNNKSSQFGHGYNMGSSVEETAYKKMERQEKAYLSNNAIDVVDFMRIPFNEIQNLISKLKN